MIVTICLPAYFSCNNTSIDKPYPDPDPDPIDTIVAPPDHTIRGQVYSLPENYSLLKKILKQSGGSETLADTTQTYTFFVQENADFAAAEIYSTGDLLAKLRAATPAVESDSLLLDRFIDYRTLSGAIETDSLLKMPLLETLVADEKIFLSLDYSQSPGVLKINDLNGHLIAPDAVLDSESEYSNRNCSNGIIHKISGNLWIKDRKPYRIYWDIAEQPEIRALSNFRQPGCAASFYPGDLSEITWEARPGTPTILAQIHYYCGTIPQDINVFDTKSQYVYADYLRFSLDLGAIPWLELKTPVLIKGTYKVWICYRREKEIDLKTTFKQEEQDDQVLPYIFDTSKYMPDPDADGFSHEAIEMQGWKMYNAKKYERVVCSHLIGVIDVQSTGRHTLRFEATTNRQSSILCSFDMIQFIPVDENQLWPRVDMLGNWIGADVEECKIFPYEECF